MNNKKISISLLILLLVISILFSFMTGYAVATSVRKTSEASAASETTASSSSSSSAKLDRLVSLIKQYSFYEIDEEDLCKSIMSGFITIKQDRYAYYFDEEEFKLLSAENTGDTQGIGITIIQDTENSCIKVVSVIKDSPAAEAGVTVGDRIVKVGTGDDAVNVSDLGYETAVKQLQGEAGTLCVFTVARGDDLKTLVDFSIERAHVTSQSVTYHICDTDKSVGIIKITGFDLTTPPQFCEAMDSLIAAGASYFIFDVRYNPGGDLASITAVLSYILNDGDIVIRTVDRAGTSSVTKVGVVNYDSTSDYATCNISESDIGKYRSYIEGRSAVITNSSTASAAELFTSSLKDYKISTVVGTTTYGKGSMQTIINLAYYGYTGALKLTTKKYLPPLSDCYDGIGIEPDVTVELADALTSKNIYDISDYEDNQLQKAIIAVK